MDEYLRKVGFQDFTKDIPLELLTSLAVFSLIYFIKLDFISICSEQYIQDSVRESAHLFADGFKVNSGTASNDQFIMDVPNNEAMSESLYATLLWATVCVGQRMLCNQTYLGHVVCHKYEQTEITGKDKKVLDAVSHNVAVSDAQMAVLLIDEIYKKLYPLTQIDEAKKMEHIENIKNHYDPSTTNNNAEKQDKKCPKCGGELVLRVAKKGDFAGNKFYGCSNYPRCKYMQSIEK